jgi:hypothetical protein
VVSVTYQAGGVIFPDALRLPDGSPESRREESSVRRLLVSSGTVLAAAVALAALALPASAAVGGAASACSQADITQDYDNYALDLIYGHIQQAEADLEDYDQDIAGHC